MHGPLHPFREASCQVAALQDQVREVVMKSRTPTGPAAVRGLLNASVTYQEVVRRTIATIQDAITAGMSPGSELEYAQLLLALAEAERSLSWVAERSRVLLGEADR